VHPMRHMKTNSTAMNRTTTMTRSIAAGLLLAGFLALAGCGGAASSSSSDATPVRLGAVGGENQTAAPPSSNQKSDMSQDTNATTRPDTPDHAAQGETVNVRVFNEAGELVGPVAAPRVVRTEEEWRDVLTEEQFRILRSAGTERPFCGELLDNRDEGVYACAGCGLPLFASSSKFKSGTGWPSFFQPIAKENIDEREDRSHGMVRTEINCARCDGHLGHVFADGPEPTGLRYCLNS